METRRRCDCLSGPCCQAVSTASPGRASVAPASDAPKMEERMEVFVSGIRPSLGECSELLSPKRTPRLGDGSRRHLTTSPHSRFCQLSPGHHKEPHSPGCSAQFSCVPGVPVTHSTNHAPPTFLALLSSPARVPQPLSGPLLVCSARLLCGVHSLWLSFFLLHLALDPLASIPDPQHPPSCLDLGLWGPSARVFLKLRAPRGSHLSQGLAGPAHWLRADACGHGIKRAPCASALTTEWVQRRLAKRPRCQVWAALFPRARLAVGVGSGP